MKCLLICKARRHCFSVCTWLNNHLSSHPTFRTGTIPFLLREKLSYLQIATFSLSSYPYALKLLWSPLVDVTFSRSIGRRNSWMILLQLVIGVALLHISLEMDSFLEDVCHFN